MIKRTKGRLALVGIAVIAMLTAAACYTPVETAIRTTMYTDGVLSVTVKDGVSGPVIGEASGPVSFTLLRPSPFEKLGCIDFTSQFHPCATWDGTMTPQGDLAGITGPWKVSLGYKYLGCITPIPCSAPDTELGLWKATSPDGTKDLNVNLAAGYAVNGTDGCPGKGVVLPSGGTFAPDFQTYYSIKLSVCSFEIHDAWVAVAP